MGRAKMMLCRPKSASPLEASRKATVIPSEIKGNSKVKTAIVIFVKCRGLCQPS
jgi:hypothetical protein